MKLSFKELSFKMKVKISFLVGFAFIIALVIHEDHAGVVLKKFKPMRVLLAEKKANKSLSTKQNSQTNVPLIESHKSVNSSVYHNETSEKASINALEENYRNNSKSNIFETKKHKKQVNRSSQQVPEISSGTNETELNSTKFPNRSSEIISSHHDIPDSNDLTAIHQQNKQRSLEFEVRSDNHTEIFLNISNSITSLLINSTESVFPSSPAKDPKDFSLREKPKNEPEFDRKVDNVSEQRNDKKNVVNNIPLINSDINPTPKNGDVHLKENTSERISDKINVLNNASGKIENTAVSPPTSNETKNENISGVLDENVRSNISGILIDSDANSTTSSEVRDIPKNISEQSDKTNVLGNFPEELLDSEFAASSFNNTNEGNLVNLQQKSDQKVDRTNKTNDSDIIVETLFNQTGLESIVSAGLDYLANSEVAKNAIEIFNLSDSFITDHIIEDSDSVIKLVRPTVQDSFIMNESSVELVDEKVKKVCPPPGICVFWFMARNTCNSDEQCLGSKICCKIRCSKQCIDV